jgi:uncharacterized protein
MPEQGERASFTWSGGTVSGVWNRPATPGAYLLLGHGAGGNLHTPGLANVAAALAAAGVGTVRFNFPYAEARRRAPDPQRTLEACYRAVADRVVEQVSAQASCLLLGGRSMGGRIASHVVAAGFPAHGLVFLSYPLHPPGKPDRLRDAHLGEVHAPMLFIQGSRDPFATPELLHATVGRLENTSLHVVENGDHGLKVRGRPEREVTDEIAGVIAAWIRDLGSRPLL